MPVLWTDYSIVITIHEPELLLKNEAMGWRSLKCAYQEIKECLPGLSRYMEGQRRIDLPPSPEIGYMGVY